MKKLIVFCNATDQMQAEVMAQQRVSEHLAACVNILPGCQWFYRWNRTIARASEVTLLLKTTAAAYPQLERHLRASHPYPLPEIVAGEIKSDLPAYLKMGGTAGFSRD